MVNSFLKQATNLGNIGAAALAKNKPRTDCLEATDTKYGAAMEGAKTKKVTDDKTCEASEKHGLFKIGKKL